MTMKLQSKTRVSDSRSTDYCHEFAVNVRPEEAFQKIGRVTEWWTKNCKGKAERAGDAFTVRFGATFVVFEVVELIPGKKAVWQVYDSNLHWLENKKEWNDTRIEWEIFSDVKTTHARMTHRGLVPGTECYGDCKEGWNFHVGESLRQLISEKKGLPDERKNLARGEGRGGID